PISTVSMTNGSNCVHNYPSIFLSDRQKLYRIGQYAYLPELEPIQAGKQHDRQQTVGNGCDQGMDRVPWLSYAHQGDLNDQVNEAMQEIKRESHEKTRAG